MEQVQSLQQPDSSSMISIIRFTGSPHKANVFTIPLLERFDALLNRVEEETTRPGSLIIIGSGRFFSAGFDLKALTGQSHGGDNDDDDDDDSEGRKSGPELVWSSWRILARLLVFPLPTIAVFNGHAFGLGFFIGMACDHRIMVQTQTQQQSYFLCLPEITIGLPLGEGFAALAKCKLSKRALKESALTGKKWTCREAMDHEIVDIIADDDDGGGDKIPQVALDLAERLLSTSEKGNLSAIKEEIYGETRNVLLRAKSKL